MTAASPPEPNYDTSPFVVFVTFLGFLFIGLVIMEARGPGANQTGQFFVGSVIYLSCCLPLSVKYRRLQGGPFTALIYCVASGLGLALGFLART